ncbi:DUF72 domain-containing protein [Flavobacterium algicola]|uniref:DUF72 domain-containing protein n=1 Tax=Flavobacterium algicola TaxID=556529 RepID=UPI001EFC7576|nr:DUF72 domain-containing protein [Flavobacterium algicola]MCG9792188.1 DUF72 domain-containing protein [Flavobacterium algicola]
MENQLIIGCSSFYNRLWKGIFYPEELPSKDWFSYYCKQFNSYEFNGSFYKFPTARVLGNWYEKTPDNFIFSIKAPKEITHVRKMVMCEDIIASFYEILQNNLKEKLGPILFQFPPSFTYNPERLQLILTSLNTDFKNVVEFRHESWWKEEVYAALAKMKITFCSVSHPNVPNTIISNGAFIYVRFHGNPKPFYSSYSSKELQEIKIQLQGKEAYVYFNNTASISGILNALDFKVL